MVKLKQPLEGRKMGNTVDALPGKVTQKCRKRVRETAGIYGWTEGSARSAGLAQSWCQVNLQSECSRGV